MEEVTTGVKDRRLAVVGAERIDEATWLTFRGWL